MYFIEFILKKFAKREDKSGYNPNNQISDDENLDYESCEHIFMPIDSTNETLSCTKCGFLVKRSELKKKNFFKK